MNASVAHPNTHFATPRRRHAASMLACAIALLLSAGCSLVGRSPTGGDASIETDGLAAQVAETRATMALEPNEPYWPYHLGKVYAAADSAEQAAAALRDALSVDAGYAPAATLLSKLYYDMRAHGAAVAALETALARNPDAPDAVRVALALHLDALGDVGGARDALAGCTQDDPDTYAARTFLALRDGESGSTFDTALRAVKRNPGSAANHNNYGIALLRTGRPGEARREFMTALEIDEDLPGALYNLAIVETFYFFDEEAGRRWFTRYRQFASDDPDDLTSTLGTDMTRLASPEHNQGR